MPSTVCANSAKEDEPFNNTLLSCSTRYHFLSVRWSHPTTNSKSPGRLSADGKHDEVAWARTRLSPAQVFSTMRHRSAPTLSTRTSPSSNKTGNAWREDRMIFVMG